MINPKNHKNKLPESRPADILMVKTDEKNENFQLVQILQDQAMANNISHNNLSRSFCSSDAASSSRSKVQSTPIVIPIGSIGTINGNKNVTSSSTCSSSMPEFANNSQNFQNNQNFQNFQSFQNGNGQTIQIVNNNINNNINNGPHPLMFGNMNYNAPYSVNLANQFWPHYHETPPCNNFTSENQNILSTHPATCSSMVNPYLNISIQEQTSDSGVSSGLPSGSSGSSTSFTTGTQKRKVHDSYFCPDKKSKNTHRPLETLAQAARHVSTDHLNLNQSSPIITIKTEAPDLETLESSPSAACHSSGSSNSSTESFVIGQNGPFSFSMGQSQGQLHEQNFAGQLPQFGVGHPTNCMNHNHQNSCRPHQSIVKSINCNNVQTIPFTSGFFANHQRQNRQNCNLKRTWPSTCITLPEGTKSTAEKNRDKRERNKLAARRCRQRKMDKIQELKDTVTGLAMILKNFKNEIADFKDSCKRRDKDRKSGSSTSASASTSTSASSSSDKSSSDSERLKKFLSKLSQPNLDLIIQKAAAVVESDTAEGTSQILQNNLQMPGYKVQKAADKTTSLKVFGQNSGCQVGQNQVAHSQNQMRRRNPFTNLITPKMQVGVSTNRLNSNSCIQLRAPEIKQIPNLPKISQQRIHASTINCSNQKCLGLNNSCISFKKERTTLPGNPSGCVIIKQTNLPISTLNNLPLLQNHGRKGLQVPQIKINLKKPVSINLNPSRPKLEKRSFSEETSVSFIPNQTVEQIKSSVKTNDQVTDPILDQPLPTEPCHSKTASTTQISISPLLSPSPSLLSTSSFGVNVATPNSSSFAENLNDINLQSMQETKADHIPTPLAHKMCSQKSEDEEGVETQFENQVAIVMEQSLDLNGLDNISFDGLNVEKISCDENLERCLDFIDTELSINKLLPNGEFIGLYDDCAGGKVQAAATTTNGSLSTSKRSLDVPDVTNFKKNQQKSIQKCKSDKNQAQINSFENSQKPALIKCLKNKVVKVSDKSPSLQKLTKLM